MNRFKIYLGLSISNSTIELNKDDVINHIKTLFDYATIYQAKGLYKNQLETTLIIEIISNEFTDNEIRNVCNYLKNRYNQECVMFTKDTIDMELV